MTLKEEPVFDKKNRFYLRNGKNDVTAISAPTEKQAMVVGATGDTTLVRVRKQTCRIRPQCLAICVFLVVVVLIIIGLIVGLATREPRKRKSQQNPFLRTTPVHEDIYPTFLTPTHVPGEYRLPVDVLPVHYTVHLHPVLGPETFYFTGNVTIKFRVVNFTEKLILHALLDEVGNMSLVSYPSLSHVPIIHTEKVERLNFLEVHIGDGGVHPGDVYVFSCTFRNKLLTNFIGIYYDTYHDAAGAQKYFLASQLESIFARRIFPCFDEPGFKANFTISITHQHHHVAITNMPKTHSTNTSTGEVTSHFQTSVRMPTYLLAFAVGEFQSVDILNDVDIQQQRIWMQNSEYLRRSIYAQTLISDQLTYFQNYFNISYSLPKLDHIGIPAKGKGAMENWGLITYGEGYLVTEVASPPQEKIDAASVIAHELSHQWFGNLVTMQWWDDLWLNEGFARCMEYVGVDSVHPDWDYWDLFLYQTLNPALSLDGLRSSREIRAHTETPSDISANFDVITYLKGGSVVRMLINFLGWDVFRVGISTYLKEYSFRNTVSNDLWRILTEVSYAAGLELDVESIMHTWTLQKNYPLVTVSRDYEHRTMQLLQTRFLLDTSPDHVSYSANETTSLFDYTWDIPFTYTDATQQSYSQPSRQWMFRENLTVTNLATPSTEWIIGNINATGFYRVNYDVTNWRLLITQLQENHQLFTPTSRAQMVDDALYLARAGLLNQSIALETTLYLSRETHMAPWVTLEVFWELFYKILSQTRAYGAYKNYMLSLLAPIYDELGWRDSGDDMERLLRSKIVTLSCQFGYQPCVQQAVNSFTRWVEDPNQFISAPLRTAVLCTGIALGGVAEWDTLWDRMQETQDPTIRDAYRDALACSNQPWLLSRYLSQALNRTLIHPHEVAWVVMATARNPIGKHQAWTFVKENWSNTGSTMLYGKTFLAEKAMDSFFTAEDVEDMLTFRSQYKDHHGYAFRYVDAAVERTHANHRWINQNLDEMNNWFIANT